MQRVIIQNLIFISFFFVMSACSPKQDKDRKMENVEASDVSVDTCLPHFSLRVDNRIWKNDDVVIALEADNPTDDILIRLALPVLTLKSETQKIVAEFDLSNAGNIAETKRSVISMPPKYHNDITLRLNQLLWHEENGKARVLSEIARKASYRFCFDADIFDANNPNIKICSAAPSCVSVDIDFDSE